MRRLIGGMKLSLDGKVAGPDGLADWVEGWSEDFGLTPQVDACLLGGGMYPTYEQYWTQIQDEPTETHPLSGEVPTQGEVEWARFAAQTPHYVLSGSVTSTQWSQTSFVTTLDQIDALKRQSGKDIYLVGGARTTASLIDAGLVDELRLLVYPLIAGDGTALFTTPVRRGLELRKVEQLADGRLSLSYELG
jgi:dihydrofolate reductase